MSNSIRLYTQDNCPYCVLMKKKLDSWGYGYTEINVSYDTDGRKFLKDKSGIIKQGDKQVEEYFDDILNLVYKRVENTSLTIK